MTETNLVKWVCHCFAICLLIPVLTGTSFADSGGNGAVVNTGGYQLSLFFAENAKVGGNPVRVRILDLMSKPVGGAQVRMIAMPLQNSPSDHHTMLMGNHHSMSSMNNMPSLPEMNQTTTTPANHVHDMSGMEGASTIARSHGLQRMIGDYFAVIAFSAPGHWIINTHIMIDGQMLNAAFPVDVVNHSTSYAILTGFAVLNVIILSVALIAKRKTVSA